MVKLSANIERELRDLAVDSRHREQDETFTEFLAIALRAEIARRRGWTDKQVSEELERRARKKVVQPALPRGRRPKT